MVRILLHGCNGHMGRVVSDLARGEQDLKIFEAGVKYFR